MKYDVVDLLHSTLYLSAAVWFVGVLGGDPCTDKCTCDLTRGYYDCRSAEFDLFPSDLPKQKSVYQLLLSGNTIATISLLDLTFYPNMRKLEMKKCGLTNIDPKTFENSENLTEVIFADNSISQLKPRTFMGAVKLVSLDLSGNSISEIPANIFSDLQKLKKLDLSNNCIQRIDPLAFTGLTSLVSLDLTVNQLRFVPVDSLSKLGSLRSLSLAGNEIHVVPSHAFRSLRKLQKLQLDDNQIYSISDLAFHGKDSAFELRKLKYLSLKINKLQEVPTFALQNLTALLTLDLSNNPISSLTESSFANLTTIRHLYLTEMKTLETIAPFTFSPMVNLEELQLHDNIQIKSLPTNAFGRMGSLQQLDLNANMLSTLSEDVFDNWEQLQYLELRLNPWHCDCQIAWLGEYLKNHSASTLMQNVKCRTPDVLNRTPLMAVNRSNCLSIATNAAQQSRPLTTVLYIMIGCVIGALFVVCLYVLYRYKSRFVKHFRDQMRYQVHEDNAESMSSRLSVS